MPSWRCADESACLRPGRSWSWPDGPPRRGFPRDLRRGQWALVAPRSAVVNAFGSWLPTGLGDAGKLPAVRHRAEADSAQAEPAVHGARAPAARAAGVPANLELRGALRFGDQALLRHSSVLPKRKSEPPQQRAALVIIGRGGDQRYVHAALPVHLVRVDLVEHELLGEAEGVVPAAVELPVAQAAEVTDPGQRQGQQPVAELPHPGAAQRDVHADRHALPELELGHRLAGPRDRRLLAGDDRQVT